MDAESGDQPAPRQAKTSEHQAVIKAQNRRREYLERTPEYFHNVEHELSGTLFFNLGGCFYKYEQSPRPDQAVVLLTLAIRSRAI